jgi:hypothetical protein
MLCSEFMTLQRDALARIHNQLLNLADFLSVKHGVITPRAFFEVHS